MFDSARWESFAFRDDDIIISTPPKSGTTWTQMLCALLIFDTWDLPEPLARLSPWLDMQTRPLASVTADLDAQTHRRFIKTHTPLDGLPTDPRVTYLCVGRDPRDVSVSWSNHWSNMDLDAMSALRAEAVGLDDLAEIGPPPPEPSADPVERFRNWVDAPAGQDNTLERTLRHLQTFWDRREEPNVALFHYSDLSADLPRTYSLQCAPTCVGGPLSLGRGTGHDDAHHGWGPVIGDLGVGAGGSCPPQPHPPNPKTHPHPTHPP
ncbi:MAG: sulfotransferase domain-containing protein, partial [Acidimicrobiales bacterium]